MVKKPILAIVAVSAGLFLNTSVQAFDLYGTTDSTSPATETTAVTPTGGATTPTTKPAGKQQQRIDTGEAARKERRKELRLREERRREEKRREERLKEEQRRAERRAARKAKVNNSANKSTGAAVPRTPPSTSETK